MTKQIDLSRRDHPLSALQKRQKQKKISEMIGEAVGAGVAIATVVFLTALVVIPAAWGLTWLVTNWP